MNFHWTGGQSCGSTSRLLLHESIAAAVLERVAGHMAEIRMGDPLDPATEMGCMVSAQQREKVERYIAQGSAEGARLLVGGGRPGGEPFERGHWVAPTLFGEVRPGHGIAREEIFGPVLSALSWSTEDEAVRIANAVPYGLTAGVWTNDLTRAHRVAHELEVGYVWLNDGSRHFPGMPFGGVKDSGLGREECVEELRSYTLLKSVNVALG
jgi:acyl-CoA reductase-like NAD-dependent aldehyde dehydrogenase